MPTYTPCLKVITGTSAGQVLRLDRPVTHVGRGSGNDLVIEDSNVSRVHVRVCQTQTGICLIDLDTTNGTTVAGSTVGSRLLYEGEEVILGGTVRLKFCHVDLPQPPAPQDIDESTGALTQQAWLDRLDQELTRARQESLQLTVALVEIDDYNLRESLMATLADILRLTLRTQALIGRLEDGLFALVLPGVSPASSKALLDGLRLEVADHRFTVCVGACGPGPDALTGGELLDSSMSALLQAQSEGKSRTVVLGLLNLGDVQTLRRQRRLSTRVECMERVSCRQGTSRLEGTIRDIGLQGLRLLTPRKLESGETFELLNQDNETPVVARVVWCKPARGQFEAGLVYQGDPALTWLRPYLEQLQGTHQPLAERRRQNRSRVQIQAWLRVPGQDQFSGQVANLGLDGGLLVAPSPLKPGQELSMCLQTFDSLPLTARVIHSYEFSPHWFMGISFEDLNDDQRRHLEKLLTAF